MQFVMNCACLLRYSLLYSLYEQGLWWWGRGGETKDKLLLYRKAVTQELEYPDAIGYSNYSINRSIILRSILFSIPSDQLHLQGCESRAKHCSRPGTIVTTMPHVLR